MSLSSDRSLEDFFAPESNDTILLNKINIINIKLNQLRYLIESKPELDSKKIYIENIFNSIEEGNLSKFIDNIEKI